MDTSADLVLDVPMSMASTYFSFCLDIQISGTAVQALLHRRHDYTARTVPKQGIFSQRYNPTHTWFVNAEEQLSVFQCDHDLILLSSDKLLVIKCVRGAS